MLSAFIPLDVRLRDSSLDRYLSRYHHNIITDDSSIAMNDAAAGVPSTLQEADTANARNASAVAENAGEAVMLSSDSAEERKRQQREKRCLFLDNLIRDLDVMIFCELSIIYYMDCSLFHFLLRALPHWFYFTPKHPIFPPPPVTRHPYVGVIFGSSLLCLLLHILYSPPSAGEASRGYLHGGLVLDFVGQASPVPIARFVALDALVLVLQTLMMAFTLEKQMLRGKPVATNALRASLHHWESPMRRQDHDLEEQGLLSSDNQPSSGENIEMQDLQYSSGRTGGDEDRERDGLLSHGEPWESNALVHGEQWIAKINLINAIRTQWRLSTFAVGTSAAPSTAAEAGTLLATSNIYPSSVGDNRARGSPSIRT